ncbi:Major Facilitator Superfamily protein [uncultured archaeon]|nr:Major Facilitator Superfamily protein [uncultured archaeon]
MLSNIPKMNLIQFLFHLQFFAAVTVPFFTEWGGLNFRQVMLLQSWFLFWVFAFEVPTGAFADKLGRKKSIVLGCITAGIGAFVYSSIPSIYIFMLAEFLWALGTAFISGADEAIIYDTLKTFKLQARSKDTFAKYSMILSLAFIIASPLGSIIAVKFGLNYPMLFSGVPMALAGIIALTLKEPKRKAETKRNYLSIMKESMLYIRRHPKLRPLVINSILGGALLYYILWLYQVMLKNSGVGIGFYGWVSSGMNIFLILLLSQITRLEALLGRKNLIAATLLIPGIAFVAGAFITNFVVTILLILAIFGAWGFRAPLYSSYFNVHIPSKSRATMLSSISMLAKIAAAVLNLFVGAMMDWSVQGTMIAIGVAALGVAVFSRVREEELK